MLDEFVTKGFMCRYISLKSIDQYYKIAEV